MCAIGKGWCEKIKGRNLLKLFFIILSVVFKWMTVLNVNKYLKIIVVIRIFLP